TSCARLPCRRWTSARWRAPRWCSCADCWPAACRGPERFRWPATAAPPPSTQKGTPRDAGRSCSTAWRGSALAGGLVVAHRRAGVDLARTADLGFRIDLLLQPVRHPAGGAADGEHDGEHLGRDLQRLVDDAAVEVDVRVQLALDEVLVLQ